METNIEQRQPTNTASGVKILIGLFFAIAGVLLTLDNLDFINAERYLRFWPLILIAIGLLKMTEAGGKIVAIILTVAGAWLLANNTRWIRVTLFDLWPVVLIGAGALIVSHALGFRPRQSTTPDSSSNILAILSTRKISIESTDFRSRNIVAFMGSVILDLPEAVADQPPAVIEVVTMWGGVEIRVPDGWEVIGEALPIMGGFEVKVRSTVTPSRQLIVKGFALMAGIEVKRKKS